MESHSVHPYMPNSVEDVRKEMLEAIGEESIEAVYHGIIPNELRFQGKLKLPNPIRSEKELKQHVSSLLNRNSSCEDYINFWEPAVISAMFLLYVMRLQAVQNF